jgi:penicillin amidase
MKRSRFIKVLLKCTVAGVFLISCLFCGSYWYLADRLPTLNGNLTVTGLTANLSIQRDEAGAVTVEAQNRKDAAFGLGFAHAQDRFFQMDLARRQASGELSALLGSATLERDLQLRPHLFKQRAQQAYQLLPQAQQALLQAYADGVNAAIDEKEVSAPEYLLLPGPMSKWSPQDSLLVIYSMYLALQEGTIERERFFVRLRQQFPDNAVCFLLSGQTDWQSSAEPFTQQDCPLPDKKAAQKSGKLASLGLEGLNRGMPGTNIWAVTADLSTSGGALLANDPHMNLSVPGVWYRSMLQFDKQQLSGFSLPGLPFLGIGENGNIAWGFSNNIGKMADYVEIELRDEQYKDAKGWQPLRYEYQLVEVAGGDTIHQRIAMTQWGPLLEQEGNKGLVLRWTAYQPAAAGLGLLHLESATTVAEGLAHAAEFGLPSLNIFVADKAGSVGWSVTGPIFDREAANTVGGRPWQQADAGWTKQLSQLPQQIKHQQGRLWNANNLPQGGDFLRQIGDGGFVEGVRGSMLKTKLAGSTNFSQQQFESWQLDNTDEIHLFWRQLALEILDESLLTAKPELRTLHQILSQWDGQASVDSAALRFLTGLRYEVSVGFLQDYIGVPEQIDMDFYFQSVNNRWDTVLRRVLKARPVGLLPTGYQDWADFIRSKVIELDQYYREGFNDYKTLRWGDRNRLEMYHPLGQINPLLSWLLNAEATPQPGNVFTLNAHVYGYGAAIRVVFDLNGVSSFNMAGGQSGHFLSPFYLNTQQDWLTGTFKKLQPAEVRYQLQLLRRREQ